MRSIAFACGIAPGLSPGETVAAAAAGGFDAVGIHVDPAAWTAQDTHEVRARVADAGLFVLDVEVIWIRPDASHAAHLRILDVASKIGAINVLAVIADPDLARAGEAYAILCREGAARGLRINLEFGVFTAVHRLADALALVQAVDSPARGILVDPIHLHRSGGSPAEVAALPRDLLSYAQFCDASASLPDLASPASILEDALDRRMQLGEGDLPLEPLLAALPAGLPLSIELRSKVLREAHPDPADRARAVARATRAFLARFETIAP